MKTDSGSSAVHLSDDVMRDLISLHLAGEASADTSALVERALRERPHLASEVERSSTLLSPAPTDRPAPRAPDLAALVETQKLLQRRSVSLGLAIFLTVLPFSCAYTDGQFWMLLLAAPLTAVVSWVAAGIAWVIYLRARRRLSLTGF